MHIEKNVCDNIFGTVLGLEAKSKDDYKSRMTLKDMGIRPHLWPKSEGNGKYSLPKADYAVSPKDQKTVLSQLCSVKYPRGYAGSLKNKIRPSDKKFLGLKTHDCHVMMQRLIPVVIRKYVKGYVADALVEFCGFFRSLCARELKKADVLQMQKDIVLIMCKLEMIFPPAFFTIMVHLCFHLPEQILLTGPVHYTWMFSTERQLGSYKKDVKNRRYPEGCIAERNIIHECVMYMDRYLHAEREFDQSVPPSNEWNISVVSDLVQTKGAAQPIRMRRSLRELAHWCVLDSCEEAQDFITSHRETFVRDNPHMENNDFARRRNLDAYFPEWLIKLRSSGFHFSPELENIAMGPHAIRVYSQCEVNGVRYVCEDRDRCRKTQNSGVYVEGTDGEPYYGVLKDVVQLIYGSHMPVILFMCQWYNCSPSSIKRDRGLISVNTNTSCYEDNPYILATNATQVFYIDDPVAGHGYKVVNHVQQRGTYAQSTLACTDNVDESYEVHEPYQEDEAICVQISEFFIDLGPVSNVYISVNSDDDSEETDDNNEYEDSDDVEGFNNSLCSDIEVDDDDEDDEDDEDN